MITDTEAMDMDFAPEIDTRVVTLNRKNRPRYGTVVEHRSDGRYVFFIVDWDVSDGQPAWRVEYPARAWWDTVQPITCPVCDSESHYFHPGY